MILTGEGDYFSSGADLTDDAWTPGGWVTRVDRGPDLLHLASHQYLLSAQDLSGVEANDEGRNALPRRLL